MGRSADFDEMLQKKYKLMERAQDNEDAKTGILKQGADTGKFAAETGRLGLASDKTHSEARMLNAQANMKGVNQAPGLVELRGKVEKSVMREGDTIADMGEQRERRRRLDDEAAARERADGGPVKRDFASMSGDGDNIIDKGSGLSLEEARKKDALRAKRERKTPASDKLDKLRNSEYFTL